MTSMMSLLQLCDSNFPSGAFSHSFGFETYIYEQTIHNTRSFQTALCTYIQTQATYTDGLACRLAYEAIQAGRSEEIWELDAILSALALAKEPREGNRRIGERFVKLGRELYPDSFLAEYEQRLKNKTAYGHSTIAFAAISCHLNISKEETIIAYLYATVQSLVQNAVRAIPLGQTDGQRLLLRVQPLILEVMEVILQCEAEELGMTTPGLELAQMRHEELPVRLFMS